MQNKLGGISNESSGGVSMGGVEEVWRRAAWKMTGERWKAGRGEEGTWKEEEDGGLRAERTDRRPETMRHPLSCVFVSSPPFQC